MFYEEGNTRDTCVRHTVRNTECKHKYLFVFIKGLKETMRQQNKVTKHKSRKSTAGNPRKSGTDDQNSKCRDHIITQDGVS